MAGPGEEKELQSGDPMVAANATNSSEPVATEPLQYVVTESESSISDREKEPVRNVRRTTEQTTSTAAVSTLSSRADDTKTTDQARAKKAWYKRLNPLKRSHKPPVPKERVPSKEYGASFFSQLTFQWMAPLMRVCDKCCTLRIDADSTGARRWAISGHSN